MCNTFSVLSIFKYNQGETNNKFILNLLLIISMQWYYRRVHTESNDIIVYGLVTRYGPQSIASATWLTFCAEKTHVYNFLSQNIQHFLIFKYIQV